MSILDLGDDADEVKKMVKKGVKDVIKPLYDDVKKDIKSIEKKVDDVPGYLKDLKNSGEDFVKEIEKVGFKVEDVTSKTIEAMGSLADEGIKFDEDQGRKWKQNCISMLETVKNTAVDIQNINSSKSIMDNGTAELLINASEKGKSIVSNNS